MKDLQNEEQRLYMPTQQNSKVENLEQVEKTVKEDKNTLLLKTLLKEEITLSEEQKEVAVNEALKQSENKELEQDENPYDLRYQILKNKNWTLEEKEQLVYNFYVDDNDWKTHLEQFEKGILNYADKFQKNNFFNLNTEGLYNHPYAILLAVFEEYNPTNVVWNEICFCESMHKIRPIKQEKGNAKQVIKK